MTDVVLRYGAHLLLNQVAECLDGQLGIALLPHPGDGVHPGELGRRGGTVRRGSALLPPCSSRDDLMIVAVELGTNAVRHTASGRGGHFVVEVSWWMKITRVAVYDGGGLSNPRVAGDLRCENGRGLLMVDALSERMGVGGDAQGRVVWANIGWTGPDAPNQPEFPELPPLPELTRPATRLSAYVASACRT